MIVSARYARFAVAAVSLAGSVVSASAQATAAGTLNGRQPNARRAQLEQRLRERTGEVVQRRLGLSADQMTRLQSVNRQFEQQRTQLLQRERETRQSLRAEMLVGDSANQAKVGQLLDQSLQLQRQRIELLQEEQRELSRFLTPVQRAGYLGLQNELRKRAQELRSGRAGGTGGPGGRRPLIRRMDR